MKPLLLIPYDDNRKIVGEVASIAGREWAEKNGFDFICGQKACIGDNPWFYKVRGALEHWIRPIVIVADADVVMRRDGACPNLTMKMQMSQNWAGICTGFFIFQFSSIQHEILRTWFALGESAHERYDNSPHDEATIKIMAAHFDWVNDAIERIPTTVVSSPESGHIGTLAHHFVASVRDQEACAKAMMELIERDRK